MRMRTTDSLLNEHPEQLFNQQNPGLVPLSEEELLGVQGGALTPEDLAQIRELMAESRQGRSGMPRIIKRFIPERPATQGSAGALVSGGVAALGIGLTTGR